MNGKALSMQTLIPKIAGETGLSKHKTRIVMTAIRRAIIEALEDGNDVTIPGLVAFHWRDAAPREFKSALTKRKYYIKRRRVLRAKVAKTLSGYGRPL